MTMEQKIARINELYRKAKTEGLTAEEKKEQAELRNDYIQSVRANMRAQLNSITIENPDGSREKLSDRVKAKTVVNKGELRKSVLAKRADLSEFERKKGRFLITERIIGHQWFYLSETVLGFMSYGDEIETRELLEEALKKGKKLYLPKVHEDKTMEFYRVESLDELVEGYKGILEPAGTTEKYDYLQDNTDKTLLLMPGVAYDKERNRIGYGGGFYDKYLSDKDALQLRSIGIGYKCQLVENVPADETDIKPYQVICV